MSIYEMKAELEELENNLEQAMIDSDSNEDDYIAEMLDRLSDLGIEYADKIDGIIRWVKNLEADAISLRAEEKALAQRRKFKENKAKNLKLFLATIVDGKYESTAGKVTLRKSKAVEVDIDAVIPSEYLTIKTTETPNKTALKKAILGGEEVVGVRVVENISASIK